METNVTLIGFGEAASTFATAGSRGYDLKLASAATRPAKQADFNRCGVIECNSAAAALAGATVVMSLVTADQALAAARDAAPHLRPHCLWLDMNSVAPATKRAAAEAIAGRGRYVDVAVMSPVHPAGRDVPLLVSGPDAAAGAEALSDYGFTAVRIVGDAIGDASAIKMIRSIMVKGIEALSAECVLAAEAAGVRDAVIESLDASWPDADWGRRFNYNLDRMMVHGERRAVEMVEAVATIDALGTGSAMTRGTVERQRAIGLLQTRPPASLDAKLAALLPMLTHRPAESRP